MHPTWQLLASPWLFLLLLWCCACGCLATSNEWQPLRIHVSIEDLRDPKKYCTTAGNNPPEDSTSGITCKTVDILSAEKNATLVNVILPEAVKLHTDRLLVKRETSPIKVSENAHCWSHSIPESHRKTGVENADFVLYVSAKPGPMGFSLCEGKSAKRHLAGAINVDPSRLTGAQSEIRAVAHEIAHVLGLNSNQMAKHNMFDRKQKLRSVYKRTITVISKKTLEKAREHFGCPTLDHVEMYNGENSEDHSHWSHRVAKDELMAPRSPHTVGRYSMLTMAAFEDLGYFKAVWGKEEPLSWGKGIGCSLFDKQCTMDQFKSRPGMFCEGEKLRCTSDRSAVGTCKPPTHHGTGLYMVDRCPIARPYYHWDSHAGGLSGSCADLLNAQLPGSLAGNDSWCLDTETLRVPKRGVDERSDDYETAEIGGVCARVSCRDKKVRVQYLGNSAWHECPEGDSISVVSPFLYSEKIKCPRYEEVCFAARNNEAGSRVSDDETSDVSEE